MQSSWRLICEPRRRRETCELKGALALLFSMLLCASAAAQSVCFPAPRLLTTMPMGGRTGTQVELAITGEHLEDIEQLLFSHPGITAAAKLRGDGTPEPHQFVVSIAADVPPGIHEARVMSRLGISSTRVFTVSTHEELKQDKPSTTVETAMPMGVDTICNSTIPAGGINHYTFEAKQGDRLVIDCAAKGIDSKLKPVLIVADTMGRDLLVERRGGALDFRVPEDGRYVIKVHDLTFKGGAEYFYRLAVQKFAADAPLTRLPSTRTVSCFSWPPEGLPPDAALAETEPNNNGTQSQKITLPADIRGSFYPAADVDTFEFNAKKGEVWWIELASERLGCPTDSSVIVQRVTSEGAGADEKLVDVTELPDILSPVKRSSNGYAYDGPPYNAGSTDALGKVEIPEDGTYRLQILDLFGGTRSDPRNVYRLIVRRAAPDFAIVAWALHLELRNGDRNALSKPLALRGGSTVALEVIAVRRDGFDGEIELTLENLPAGVTSAGLKIPAGGSRGIMLVTASQDAPRGLTEANFYGTAMISGTKVERRCHWASPAWPIRDSWSEVPVPRLVNSFPVSVGGSEVAPISIAARENKTWEVMAGESLKVPLAHVRRGQFSGATMSLKTFGAGFESMPAFDVSLEGDQSEAVLDLAKLQTLPGEYRIAFYGSPVAKYRYNPRAVAATELAHQQAQTQATAAANELELLTRQASAAATEQKGAFEQSPSLKAATDKKKAADEAVTTAAKKRDAAKTQAEPSDIVDIVVSEPITIRVQPAEKK